MNRIQSRKLDAPKYSPNTFLLLQGDAAIHCGVPRRFVRFENLRVPCANEAENRGRDVSAAINGIETFPVEVAVNSGWGDMVVVIDGLSDATEKAAAFGAWLKS
jgi:hypothetical protein